MAPVLSGFYLLTALLCTSAASAATTEPVTVPDEGKAGQQAGQQAEQQIVHHGEQQIIAMDIDPTLRQPLIDAVKAMGSDYTPRTEHLLADGSPQFINRLILEDSPYLHQHAHNPVNWYAWGDEAFAAAKAQDKPVFLSIGYATCHWCHVMERESFEDLAIAELLNENFIAIKVDREQLPDIDALYMTAVMMINGNGGWPMSSWLDAEGRPFFGGTYYPPEHFTGLLSRIDQLWDTERETLLEQAGQIAQAMHRANQLSGEAVDVGENEIEKALQAALSRFDAEYGGFGGAPKFPQEPTLYFLLEQAQRTGNEAALNAADVSLERMAAGGIHDQIGGGFHRYSVDERWLVPHFEKMLYNQAALARNYTRAYLLTGKASHARTARRTLDYVLREMTSREGLFYSATDADSEGEEGTFFIWTPEEIQAVLSEQDAELAIAAWDVSEIGNFEGRNILNIDSSLAVVAKEHGISEQELENRLYAAGDKLLAVRDQRERPLLDNKILTGWNGMMITAFAEAADALDEPRYLQAAKRSAEQLWQTARAEPGRLWRSRFAGRSGIDATQVDYAFYAEALLSLYDIVGDSVWLDRAREITDAMIDGFWDAEQGGFFMGASSVAGTTLAARPKDLHDASRPSGNAVALRVMARLSKRTGELVYREHADKLIAALSAQLAQQPSGFYYLLTGLSEHVFGESGPRQYAANGKVRAIARKTADDQVTVSIDIAPGWHINANKPLQDYLIATQLTGDAEQDLPDTVYPEPITRTLGFQRAALSLYEESVTLTAALPVRSATGKQQPLHLQLQACNDQTCLAPETLTLNLAAQ